jgi:tetratricopeptide (TPR) repeat protein
MLRGKYRRAERDLLRALQLLGPYRGNPTPEHLATWNERGIVHKYLGNYREARQCYLAALRYAPSSLSGSARYDFLASLYHNLGGLEHSRRRFRRAESYARKSIEYRVRVKPRNAVSIAADRVALAAILDCLGAFDESMALYRSALKTYRRAYGASHREIALVLNNVAAVYQRTGQLGRAQKMYRAALAMKRKTLGGNHPDLAVTLNNLGMLLADANRTVEAKSCFEKAQCLLNKSLGRNHPNVRAVRQNLERLRRVELWPGGFGRAQRMTCRDENPR